MTTYTIEGLSKVKCSRDSQNCPLRQKIELQSSNILNAEYVCLDPMAPAKGFPLELAGKDPNNQRYCITNS